MKTVLITGAARGIGQSCAREFYQNEYNIVVHYRSSKAQAQVLAEEFNQSGRRAISFGANISDPAQVRAMAEAARQAFGGVDVLVNNAGIAQQKLFQDITENDLDHMFDVNVKGIMYCAQAVLPDMLEKKSGKIINISSIWGMTGASCEVHYSAAKAAVIGFTKALAKELGPSNIQVNCVAPGVIDTDMIADLDRKTRQALQDETPLGRLGTPEDIAHAVCFLASPQADFMTGQILSPNGGIAI